MTTNAPEQPRPNTTPIREGGVYDSHFGDKLATAVMRVIWLGVAALIVALLLWGPR